MQAPHERRRRGRQALLWAGLSLVVAHLALAVALRQEARILDSPRMRQGVRIFREARQAGPPRATVAMLGSSRAQDAFNPQMFMATLREGQGMEVEAYNFGHPGAGAFRNWVNFHRLTVQNALPDLLFVEVFPPLYNGTGDADGLIEHLETHMLYPGERDELRRRGWLAPVAGGDATASLETPWHANRSPLLRCVAPRWLDTMAETVQGPHDRGWYCAEARIYPSPQWDHRLEELRSQYEPSLQDFRPNPAATAALTDLLDEADRRGVQVVLVLAPEGPKFRSFYAPAAAAQLEAFVRALAEDHHAQFINARTWFDDEALFSDSHHLQCDGANRFSRRLADEARHLLRPTSPPGGYPGSPAHPHG